MVFFFNLNRHMLILLYHIYLLYYNVQFVYTYCKVKICNVCYFIGKIAPWTGRFYTLLDPSYAKNHIPIIASVSEHQPTSWSSFYFDLHIQVFLFPVGLYFCFSKLTDANIFVILYGVTSIYFAVRIFTFFIIVYNSTYYLTI